MKIGIYGGTFDPVHKAHINLALAAYKQANLDKLYFMLNFKPPHKKDHKISSYNDRKNMLNLAISKYPFFSICEIERERKENSYTSVSLAILKQRYKMDDLYFVMGADSFLELNTWFEYKKIFSLVNLLIIDREYIDKEKNIFKLRQEYIEKYNANINILNFKKTNISSEQIRNSIRANKDCSNLLNENVLEYIRHNNLYR